MSQRELLGKLAKTLENAGIDYMVTGAIASSLQGAPRITHDIDVVVTIRREDADMLIGAFPPPDYYLDRGSIIEAIRRKSSFNLVEVNTGFKVDFWLLTEDPFDQSRFSRKYTEELEEFKFHVSAPEDAFKMKLKCIDGTCHHCVMSPLRHGTHQGRVVRGLRMWPRLRAG